MNPRGWWHTMSPKSQAMILCGVVWVIIGLGVLKDASIVIPEAFHTMIPHEWRGCVWVATGTFAAYAGVTMRHKRMALTLLQVMPSVRVFSYAFSWISYLAPGGSPGYPDGWYQAAFQSCLILLVLFSTQLPDHRDMLRYHDAMHDPREG